MTGQEHVGHAYWEEQAAGYALDALEPEEAAAFVEHLASCGECRRLVDQHSLVAAQLGALAYDDRPAPTWAQLRDGIVGPSDEGAPTVVPIRRRRAAILMSAAAAAIAAVVAITVWQTAGDSGHGPLTSTTSCAHTAGCHVVALTVPGTRGEVGLSVLAYGHDVALVPSSLSQAPSGSELALWRVPKVGSPQLMTTFDRVNGTRAANSVPLADIAAFAVSREPAGTTPTKPSTIVAYGATA